MTLRMTVNNKAVQLQVAPDKRLIDILREDLQLKGTKEGCSEGECGACTVMLDQLAVHSCLQLALHLEGKTILTIEGLEENGELDVIQNHFINETAIQCGYCTTGMIMTTKALLLQNPNPTEEDIRLALSGNICRCSGYTQIITAVQKSAAEMGVGH